MALLIDTSLLIAAERGDPGLLDSFDHEETAISPVTVSELMYGVHASAPSQRILREIFADRIVGSMQVVPIDEAAARAHAQLVTSLAQVGQSIGLHDSWIAASALTSGYGVATLDFKHFSRVPGLRVVSPS